MFTSADVCSITGITYRQLDHWTTRGVLNPDWPARGSGSRRVWSDDDVRLVALGLRLSELGCPLGTIAKVTAVMSGWPADLWAGTVVVYPDGDVDLSGDVKGAAWVVDLAACRVWEDELVLTALAS